jgi:soluble cytochrome b562
MQALMDELRKALDDYMSEEAKKNPADPNDETSPQQKGPSITQDQIQQMMDKIQQLMEEGKTAEAAEAMRQLQDLLNNMKVQQGDGQGQGQGPAGKAMKDLGNTLRDQQGLSDDAFRDLQDGQESTQPGEKSLSERQQELRKRLEAMKNGSDLPGKGNDKGQQGRDKLGDAGRSMEEAERALRDGDLPGALDKQAEAMDKMRQGLRDFGDALAEEQRKDGSSPDGQQTAEADPNGTRDPLGRENSARIGSDKNLLQGEDVYRRAQELLDEIRKRSGEQARPETERNYLKRLLDLF